MPKLVYWVADCKNDSSFYSVRAKTKREVEVLRFRYGEVNFEEPRKHTIEYRNSFDLMEYCMSESRGGE
jgi:hypothetical protein